MFVLDDDIVPFENQKMRNRTSEDQEEELQKEYWNNKASLELQERLRRKLNSSK